MTGFCCIKENSVGDNAVRNAGRVFLVVVDDSQEMPLALHYACRRVAKIGGRVALLHVIQNADFQHWLGVGNLYSEEMRDTAESLMKELSAQVMESTGNAALTYVREGESGPELYDLLRKENDIQAVVLAASTAHEGPGPIINYAFNKGMGLLPKPFIIIPGSMSKADIDALT